MLFIFVADIKTYRGRPMSAPLAAVSSISAPLAAVYSAPLAAVYSIFAPLAANSSTTLASKATALYLYLSVYLCQQHGLSSSCAS